VSPQALGLHKTVSRRPSGRRWIGDIPEHWLVPPVYSRFELLLGKMLDEKQITRRHLAPYLRNIDVQWDSINTDNLPEMDFDEGDRKRLALRPGDLLVCEGGEAGRTAIWQGQVDECFFQKAIHRLRPLAGLDHPRYFYWVMRYAVSLGVFSAHGNASTIEHLPAEKLRLFRYPSPPVAEQQTIAAYLDRETTRLDALLAAKERLIKLLAEKRQALITHAVTRGLVSAVPLRDSGIPWLGAIPKHWETERVAFAFRERDERGEPELPLLEVSINAGVVRREFSEERIENVAADFNTYKVARTGDIVFNKMRMWQGAVGAAPCDGLVSPDYTVAIPLGTLDSGYAESLFRTALFSAECARHSHGIVWDRLRLYWEGFRDIRIPVPPLAEQRAIVGWIARETGKLDAMREATERTVGLLRERRAALIAAAVTGQLPIGARNTEAQRTQREPGAGARGNRPSGRAHAGETQ
jgi:type I restriction enzyme S subunit